MDSLIHDNRNTVLKTLFEEHVFGALSKRREGGLRFLVRTEDAQKALLGVEISVLGRKFRFAAESPLAQCFFVDITGVDTAATATAIFKALASRGARAVYFRRDLRETVGSLLVDVEVLLPRGRATDRSGSRRECARSYQGGQDFLPLLW